jgi:pimeloyl-ACP methyl ester carboxylesterase
MRRRGERRDADERLPLMARATMPAQAGVAAGAPAWFRLGAGFVSAAAPRLAAPLAEWMFVRPPGRGLSAAESAWAADAVAGSLATPSGTVPLWRWGTGPRTVLLAHGWGGRGPQLGAVARALAAGGWSAVAWDMPGHGDRARPTSLLEMAETVAAVAESVGPVAGVVAHSFGTAATLVAAGRYGFRLERLAALAPAASPDRIVGHFSRATGFSPAVLERMRARLARRLEFEWRELEPATIIPRLACAALIVHDRDDTRIPVEEGIELAALLPGAELALTSGLGHREVLRDAAVLDRIGEFFRR